MQETPQEDAELPIVLIKSFYLHDCPSLSGKTTLTYVVGKDAARNTLHLAIVQSTGNGHWFKGWTQAQDIEAILAAQQRLNATSFCALYPGRSVNTGGFILAALSDLGLVQACPLKRHQFQYMAKSTLEHAVMARLEAQEGRPARRKKGKVTA